MKKTQFLAEIHKGESAALVEKERALGEELMKLRFRKASGQLTQTHELQRVQRDLARVKTVRRARQQSSKA